MDNKQNQAQSLSQTIVIAVLVSLLAFAALILVGRVLITRFTFQNKVLDGKTKAEKVLVGNKTAINSLTKQYNELGTTKTVIGHALPASVNFPELTVMLENISKVSNVKLLSVDTAIDTSGAAAQSTSKADTPTSSSFTITIEGTYPNLMALLKNLEKSARPMNVTAITVGNSGANLNVQLTITTYHQATNPLAVERKEVE